MCGLGSEFEGRSSLEPRPRVRKQAYFKDIPFIFDNFLGFHLMVDVTLKSRYKRLKLPKPLGLNLDLGL